MNNFQTINFHGDEIVAMKDENSGKIFVNIRKICESLGIKTQNQLNKLRENSVFSEGLSRTPISTVKGERESWFLDAELLQGWLCTIQAKRIKPEIREKLIKYQREAFKALHDHFTQGFSLNEAALERFPDVVLDKLSERISQKLNIAPPAQHLERRLGMLEKVFKVLGKPHEEVLAVLREQAIAEVTMQVPAPTLRESDFWYAADYFAEKKKEGWKNALYKDVSGFLKAFGRRAGSVARRHNFKIVKQNQVLVLGRVIEVNLHCRECLDLAFEEMVKEGKVVRQLPLTSLPSGGNYL